MYHKLNLSHNLEPFSQLCMLWGREMGRGRERETDFLEIQPSIFFFKANLKNLDLPRCFSTVLLDGVETFLAKMPHRLWCVLLAPCLEALEVSSPSNC